jgi:hypothetical protein
MKNCTRRVSIGIVAFLILFSSFTKISRAQSGTLRINEFMALNESTLTDEDSEYSDWIEIYNTTSGAVSLAEWSLTDDKSMPQKWIFPEITLEAYGYLIVFASGKDRDSPGYELHTNFRLSGSGEYLALFDSDGMAVTEFDPMFPEQQPDVSYGYFEDTYVGFTVPTPGAENDQSGAKLLPSPVFSQKHGFFEAPFDLEISSGIENVEIYYTTDGTTPDMSGTLYTSPINIATTTVVRAVIFLNDEPQSKVTTQTYLFLDDVIHQPNDPAGYPDLWGPYVAITGTAIADYEMDPELMADAGFANSVKEALLDIPTISLVTDKGFLFSHTEDPDIGGIYIYTGPPLSNTTNGVGFGWERPVSFEFFDASDSVSLQINCGVILHGGHSRRPEKCPKHSFRFVFKDEYGPTRLNYPFYGDEAPSSFNSITLRAGFGNTWLHWTSEERNRAQYLRDTWGKDTQLDMGHPSSHVKYVHLYLNGIYWGVYASAERMDADFAASYIEGNEEDFDVIKDYAEVVDGNITAWNTMMATANAGLESNEDYQRIQGNDPNGTPNPEIESYVDVVNLIDYMLINFYGGNTDWDHHNWAAMRNRVNPGKGFKFFMWDAEHILKSVSENVLNENNENCPSRVFQQLRQNEDFCRLFADRVQKYCFNGGLLTPQSAAGRWIERRDQIDKAVNAESARWGDYRRDVHPWQNGPFELYTKESHWLVQQDYMLDDYFPNRTSTFLNQLRSASLFPSVSAPGFLINDNPVIQNTISTGDILSMTSQQGTIYYTTDGTDPVVWQSSQGYNETVLVAENASKRVRVPKSDIGNSWRTDIDYNDSDWQLCSGSPGGIGYDINTGYTSYITLDVSNDMHSSGTNPNNSCYIRIPFNVSADDLSSFSTLMLSVRYDDGFVAYLNGNKVAEVNAPAALQWNSVATGGHEAVSAEAFYISEYLSYLTEGENFLAIQGLNLTTTSSDFLITAELKASDQPSSGNSSPGAKLYSQPITINESSHFKARTFYNGEWSALTDRFFIIPADFYDIKITEIHYHPLGQDIIDNGEFEFIEIKNTGTSTLDLGGIQFVQGIIYEFPPETELGPQDFIVLASNSNYFYSRYGFLPFDEYNGQLANGGEWILLASSTNDTLCSIIYEDGNGWPSTPDGFGNSLVPVELNPGNDQNSPFDWRASYAIGGSPGADDLFIEPVTVEEFMVAESFTLSQNYPNPFSDLTYIDYMIPDEAHVQLSVYNIVGQHVVTLVNKRQAAGLYQVMWDGADQYNNKLNNGVYIYRLVIRSQFETKVITKKMMIMN